MPVSENQKGGFTYVELLAVTLTALVLGTALWPRVPRAHCKSLQMRCVSNLTRLGSALQMYAQTHQDSLPGPVFPVPEAGYTDRSQNELSWYIAQELGCPQPSTNAALAKDLLCPAYRVRGSFDRLVTARTYVLNENINKQPGVRVPPFGRTGSPVSAPLKISAVADYGPPMRLFAMTDADKGTVNPLLTNWGDLPYRPVHDKSRSYLFFDGHVEVRAW